MKTILCLAAALVLAAPTIAADKAKAKAKAAAALALAKAADLDRKPIANAPPVLTDFDEAQSRASAQAKPLVLWVDAKPPAETLKAVDVVHCSVPEYAESKDARVIVFTCDSGRCNRKASVNTVPSAELLKEMVNDAKKEPPPKPAGKITAADSGEFFISFGSTESTEVEDNETLPPPEPVKVKRYETRYVQQCVNGVCRLVPVNVEVTDEPQKVAVVVKAPAASSDCPCVASSGSCSCGTSAQSAVAGGPVRSWFANRPRILGRLFGGLFGGCR